MRSAESRPPVPRPRPRLPLSSLAAAVKEVEDIPAYLPSGAALKDAVQKARDWLRDVEALQVGQRRPRGRASAGSSDRQVVEGSGWGVAAQTRGFGWTGC